jgi:hypothetical protein
MPDKFKEKKLDEKFKKDNWFIFHYNSMLINHV